MATVKLDRVMELFFRGLKGEALSVRKLADQYRMNTRTISRDISALKMFLADNRELIGNAELAYSHKDSAYRLVMDEFLASRELLAITKALIGCRAFSKQELLKIIGKLKKHTSYGDRKKMENLVGKEISRYPEILFRCASVIDNVWDLTECIEEKKLITISYYRMDDSQGKKQIMPLAIMFTEYYYYLIAYDNVENEEGRLPYVPKYYRCDRIVEIQTHRSHFTVPKEHDFDEGYLRERSLFMWPGKLQKISFEFSGPSVRAVLDRIPTATLVEEMGGGTYRIEAETYGSGIKMFLLSQGAWVKVLSPEPFVREMKDEVEKMRKRYEG